MPDYVLFTSANHCVCTGYDTYQAEGVGIGHKAPGFQRIIPNPSQKISHVKAKLLGTAATGATKWLSSREGVADLPGRVVFSENCRDWNSWGKELSEVEN